MLDPSGDPDEGRKSQFHLPGPSPGKERWPESGRSALFPPDRGRDNMSMVVERTRPPGPVSPVGPSVQGVPCGGASQRDPEFIERVVDPVRRYTRYFSPEVRGIEYLPATGPALLIGNHNCIYYMPDLWVTALAIVERRGTEHPAFTLTYDLLFSLPVVAPFLRRIGAIPAGSDDAAAMLAEGALVLDYPGGDREACRPWVDRNTVDFGGRTGFIRLALRAGVPIVPVVAHGSHDAVVVVSRGEGIARILGLGALRVKVFPILLGPLGLTTALAPPLPMPSSITVEFLPPIDFSHLGPGAAEQPEVVDRCAAEVIGVMQAALDRLRVERAHPVRRGFVTLASHVFGH